MKSKFTLSLVLFSLISVSAHAATTFQCVGKTFTGNRVNVSLHGVLVAPNEVSSVTLLLDGSAAFNNITMVADPSYRPRKYEDYNRFPVCKDNLVCSVLPSTITLLLPKNLGQERSFAAYIVEKASEGGAYNKVTCRLM